jgi:ribonuclease P protein component
MTARILVRPATRRQLASKSEGRIFHGQGQAHLPAEQPPAGEGARIPASDAHARGSRDPVVAPPQGPRAPCRLISFGWGVVRERDVRRVLDIARPVHGGRVVVFLAPGTGASAVVASRRIGGAVQRNRARRILRAAWSQVAPQVGDGYDAVLVARTGIRGAKTQDLVAEMRELLST